MEWKKKVFQTFQMRGMNLRGDAMKEIVKELGEQEDPLAALQQLLGFLQEDGANSSIVTLERAQKQLQRLRTSEDVAIEESIIDFLDAFETPKFNYDVNHKRFYKEEGGGKAKGGLHAEAGERAHMFSSRIATIKQRLLRHPQFSPPATEADKGTTNYHKITPLDALDGSVGGSKYVLGKLSEITEGKYYLEDASAKIPLDLTKAVVAAGCFTTGCIVLAEGKVSDGIFHVDHLGHPIPESKETTQKIFPKTDFFGLEPEENLVSPLKTLEEEDPEASLLVLSDVNLDLPSVWMKLQKLLDGYADDPPVAIILFGNFLSTNFGDEKEHYQTLCSGLERLGRLFSRYPTIVRGSKIIIIPGPGDPQGGGVLPRPSLSSVFFSHLSSALPSALSLSNPARLRYCSKNIVAFRDNLVMSLRRHSIIPPNKDLLPSMNQHAVKTVLDQGYLCPLPLHVRPVYWGHSHALSLYPLPDVVILADTYNQYSTVYEGCRCFNPGSFAQDHTFVAYYPSTHDTEFCKIEQSEGLPKLSMFELLNNMAGEREREGGEGEEREGGKKRKRGDMQISDMFQRVEREEDEEEEEEEEEGEGGRGEEEEDEEEEELEEEELQGEGTYQDDFGEEEEGEDGEEGEGEEREEEEGEEGGSADMEVEPSVTLKDSEEVVGGEKGKEKEEVDMEEDEEDEEVDEDDLSDYEREERKKEKMPPPSVGE